MSHNASTAAILAGGRATRFGGRDKSALRVNGRTILERQLAALSTVADEVLIVRADLAAPDLDFVVAERSASHAVLPRAIADIAPGCGPLGGLHAALTEMRGDRLLLVACDMPFVTAAFAEYLLSLADGVDIVVPETERGYHPLCAVYARTCLERVTAQLAARRLRLRDLIGEVRTRVVTSEDIARFGSSHVILANVNTPAEYAGLEALPGHKP
jgi:molybdopterin-guanine dinucleotide biosynthesis protein A